MELPKSIVKSFTNIRDANSLSHDIFEHTLENIISYINKNTIETQTSDLKTAERKNDFANIICLFVEAARYDLDGENLQRFLQGMFVNDERAKKLCDVYVDKKKIIQTQLELIGYNPPHVIDVDWRLDYCIKFNTCSLVGVPLYHIRLHVKEHKEVKYVAFTCTIQGLQELVSKLKDVTRHLEKLSNG